MHGKAIAASTGNDHCRILNFDFDPMVIQREQQYLRLDVLGPAAPGAVRIHPTEAQLADDNISDGVIAPMSTMEDEDDLRSQFGATYPPKVIKLPVFECKHFEAHLLGQRLIICGRM